MLAEKIEKVKKHLAALEKKHEALDLQIQELAADPSIDSLKVNKLKKDKLQIKEDLEAIKAELKKFEDSLK